MIAAVNLAQLMTKFQSTSQSRSFHDSLPLLPRSSSITGMIGLESSSRAEDDFIAKFLNWSILQLAAQNATLREIFGFGELIFGIPPQELIQRGFLTLDHTAS